MIGSAFRWYPVLMACQGLQHELECLDVHMNLEVPAYLPPHSAHS